MKKSVMLIIFCSSIYSTNSLSIERPVISEKMQNEYESYMDDIYVNAFVCSNKNTTYVISKRDLGLVYTNQYNYMFNKNSGISFELSKCLPASIHH